MTIDQAFGKEMKRLRKTKGISQRELGKLVGLDSGYISRIENGLFKPPSEAKIVAIAHEIGANPDLMLSLSGKVSSDVKSAVQDNPEGMAEAVRKMSKYGDKLELALAFGSLATSFFQEVDSDQNRKSKVKKLIREIIEQASILPSDTQHEIMDDIKLLLIDWEMELG